MWHQEKNSNLVGHGESVLLVRLPSWGPDNSKVNLSWHGPSSWPSGQQNWPRSPGFNPCNLWTFVEEPVILKLICCQCKREKSKISIMGLMALDQKVLFSSMDAIVSQLFSMVLVLVVTFRREMPWKRQNAKPFTYFFWKNHFRPSQKLKNVAWRLMKGLSYKGMPSSQWTQHDCHQLNN